MAELTILDSTARQTRQAAADTTQTYLADEGAVHVRGALQIPGREHPVRAADRVPGSGRDRLA